MSTTPEVCIGAVVFDDDGRLLLIERGRGAAVGQWSIPGGRVEPGETLEAAVEREVLEETGLAVRCGRFVGWVQRISADYHFVIMDFVAEPVSKEPGRRLEIRAGDDASGAAWVPVDQLVQYELVAGLMDFLNEHQLI